METHPIHAKSSDLACLEPSVVSLRLAAGGERRIEIMHPRGTPQRPLSEAEMSEKFRSCAVGVLSPEAVAATEATVANLDRLADVRALLGSLRSAPD